MFDIYKLLNSIQTFPTGCTVTERTRYLTVIITGSILGVTWRVRHLREAIGETAFLRNRRWARLDIVACRRHDEVVVVRDHRGARRKRHAIRTDVVDCGNTWAGDVIGSHMGVRAAGLCVGDGVSGGCWQLVVVLGGGCNSWQLVRVVIGPVSC